MHELKYLIIPLLALTALQLPEINGAKILATFPFPGRSQKIFVESYLETLADRGHEVTVINTFQNKPRANMRFITAPKILEYYDEMLAQLNPPTLWQKFRAYSHLYMNLTECLLQEKNVQNLLQSGEKFDLVIAEMLQTEALFGLGQHFNATMIGVSAYGCDYLIDGYMGNTAPLSYNPLITSPRTEIMSFYERLENHYEQKLELFYRWLNHIPNMERLYEKYFPRSKKTLSEVLDSFSLMLLGQHFSFSYSRTYLPNMIEVGGLHIPREPKALPEDIRDFIESSTDGVIFFSLGSNVKSKDLPANIKEVFLKVFGSLKQRVLWKFEDAQLPDKPDNVFISKWFPQADILAHPKVVLFITHGGLLSTLESVYFGKPMLGLPVFFDQFMNVKRIVHMGLGLGLDLLNLKESELQLAINTVLNTPSYTETLARLSERYRDQPESPMDRAIWWTEYIIRHRGAPYMRAASRDMTFIEHHSLDTLTVLIIIPIVFFCLLIRYAVWPKGKQNKCDKQKYH